MTDPLFALPFEAAKVRFEEAGELLARCPELTNARWSRRLWLFARSAEPSGSYVVVGGLYERRDPPNGEKRFEPDPKGVLLREHDSKCDLIGPAREVFDYPAEGVAPETLRALARDAVNRYSAAFGGEAKFLAALARGKREADLANPRSAILREAVEQARR